jgi:hypothetical protein
LPLADLLRRLLSMYPHVRWLPRVDAANHQKSTCMIVSEVLGLASFSKSLLHQASLTALTFSHCASSDPFPHLPHTYSSNRHPRV